jgi:hypothetical protein
MKVSQETKSGALMTDPDATSPETVAADEADAHAAHRADRMPTPEEEAAAEGNEVDPSVAEAYEQSMERGANVEGEGQI